MSQSSIGEIELLPDYCREVYISTKIENHRIMTCCHIQKGSGIIFDTDFKVLPCNHFAEFPFADEFDISDPKSIKKLWTSEAVKEFRKYTQYYPSKHCSSCDLWNKCGGGCFTRWLYENPDEFITRPIKF